jgi:oligopeptidase A
MCLSCLIITHVVISENPAQNVFVEVLDPLEKHGAPLDTTWGLVKTLYLTNKNLMPAKAYVNIHDKARQSRAVKFNSECIYEACKVKYLSI